MDEVERLPCPLCAEPIAVEARLCPHCRNAALVDLVLEAPSQAPRQRYQVARAVSGLGAPFPSFVESQQSLAGGGPAAWNLALGEARRAVEGLKRLKVAAKTVPASGRGQFDETVVEGKESRFRRPVLYGLVAAAVVVGFVTWRRAPAPTPTTPAPVPPALVPVAGRPPAVAQPGAEPSLSNAALARAGRGGAEAGGGGRFHRPVPAAGGPRRLSGAGAARLYGSAVQAKPTGS